MAHTKLKLAALATAIVASLGMVGASAAASSDAGHRIGHQTTMRGDNGPWCC